MCVIAEVQRCGAIAPPQMCVESRVECVCGEPQRVGAAPVAYRDQSRGRAGVCPRRLLRPQELHCRARASVSVLCKPNHRRLERPHGLLPTRPCARNQSFARAFGQLPSALRFKASLRAGGRMRCPRGGAALRRLVRARQLLPQVPTATAPARTLPMGLAPPMARHPPRRPPLAWAKTDVCTHTEAHPLTRAHTCWLY